VNFKRLQSVPPVGPDAYLLYHKCVQSTQIYAYDSTFVSPFTLLLFGGEMKIDREHSLSLDRYVRVGCMRVSRAGGEGRRGRQEHDIMLAGRRR
jgi:hypothetical protein